MNRSREARIAEASVIASRHVQLFRIALLVSAAELAAPQRVAVDAADLGNPSDRDPGRVAAASQMPSLMEHSRYALLPEDIAGCLGEPLGRQIDGIVIVPADCLTVVDPGCGFHTLD